MSWIEERDGIWNYIVGPYVAKAYVDPGSGVFKASFDRWKSDETYEDLPTAKSAALSLARDKINHAYIVLNQSEE